MQVRDALVGVGDDKRGPLCQGADRGGDLVAALDRRREPARIAPSPSLAVSPASAILSPYVSNTSAKYALTTWPKMIGSLTFIIVALRCTE